MRLLFVHDHRFRHGRDGEFYSPGSFPATVWERYLRHFDRVTVLARDGGPLEPGSTLLRSSRASVEFEFAPSLSSFRHLLWPGAAVRRQISDAVTSADAVVARLPSELGLLAVKTAREIGKPYAVEVVGCAWDGYGNHGAPAARLYAGYALHRTRRAVKDAPLALYVTSSWLQGRYPTRGRPVAVSDVEIAPMDEAEKEQREQRLRALADGRTPQLGTIASLTIRSKGIQTAIPALALLRKEGLELPYAVLGAGDSAPWEALARKHGVSDLVSFDGTREAGSGVRAWLDGIDIYLQPSFQEGLPRATVEAMSRGAACVGSTCGGLPELVPPDRTHRPGDVAGLADCIRRLVTDPAATAEASRTDFANSAVFQPDHLRTRRDEFYGRLRASAEQPGSTHA